MPRLKIVDCNMMGGRLDLGYLNGLQLDRVDLNQAHMCGAWLREARLDATTLAMAHMAGADLQGVEGEDADLSFAVVTGVDFSYSRLIRPIFYNANAEGAHFFKSRLTGASFESANLSVAHFGSAELEGADFSMAKLDGASFVGATLRGAGFFGDMRDIVCHKDELAEQLPDMFGDKQRTLLPGGLAPPDHWAEYGDQWAFGKAHRAFKIERGYV